MYLFTVTSGAEEPKQDRPRPGRPQASPSPQAQPGPAGTAVLRNLRAAAAGRRREGAARSDGGGAAAGPAGLGRAGAAPQAAPGLRGVSGARPGRRGHAADAGRRAGGVAGEGSRRVWGLAGLRVRGGETGPGQGDGAGGGRGRGWGEPARGTLCVSRSGPACHHPGPMGGLGVIPLPCCPRAGIQAVCSKIMESQKGLG